MIGNITSQTFFNFCSQKESLTSRFYGFDEVYDSRSQKFYRVEGPDYTPAVMDFAQAIFYEIKQSALQGKNHCELVHNDHTLYRADEKILNSRENGLNKEPLPHSIYTHLSIGPRLITFLKKNGIETQVTSTTREMITSPCFLPFLNPPPKTCQLTHMKFTWQNNPSANSPVYGAASLDSKTTRLGLTQQRSPTSSVSIQETTRGG